MRMSVVYWRYCGDEGASISQGSRRAGLVCLCVLRFYRDISTADIVAFKGRQFRDGTYGYAVLYNNGAYFGKVARWALASFDQVQVLDLTEGPNTEGLLRRLQRWHLRLRCAI